MNTALPEELQMLQRSVREFVDTRLAPLEREIEEKDEIPRAVIDAMAGMGLFGLGFREEAGGQGFGKLGYCVAVEQLARTNASLWNVIGGSAGLCGTAIDIGGPDAVRTRYLPDLLAARKIGAYGSSEPGAGGDAARRRTTARRDGDSYVIDGAKTFITNAPIADVFVIFTTLDPKLGSKAITAFVVERATAGVEVGRNGAEMGLHGSATARLHCRGRRVSP